MNPFDEVNELDMNISIKIWVEQYGRKKITYISGWDIPHPELSEHLKVIKKSNGCNGTIKNKVLQLQGVHIDYLKEYLTKQNISDEDIRVIGY